MSIYEDLEIMAIKKDKITLDFATKFMAALRTKMGTTTKHLLMPQSESYTENGVLITKIVLSFNDELVKHFKEFKVDVTITTTSKDVVVMGIKREKIKIELLDDGVSESFESAVQYVSDVFKKELDFTA